MKIYDKIGCAAPEILIPREGIDLEKWAVIACDQFTSEPEFWTKADEMAGTDPSALRLILPEYYLPVETAEQQEARLKDIKETAERYLSGDVFRKLPAGFILTDRSTSLHPSRKGLMIAIDLEAYSFRPEDKALVRATEGTVLERIPPRVKIRSNSPVELPHVMLLIDDPEGTVIENAWNKANARNIAPVYDTDLMQGCGHIKGVFVPDEDEIAEGIRTSLEKLLDNSGDNLLFLVGDGNHSLASAKAYWESVRETLPEDQRRDHPARFALTEVVNIHDKGLDFEPIYRLVSGISRGDLVNAIRDIYETGDDAEQSFTVIDDNKDNDEIIKLKNPPHSLAVGSCDMILKALELNDVDYIHGEDSLRSLAKGSNAGVLLPGISKDTFFATVAMDGIFPRKTFSMGEAFEKRFYLEARLIR
ncbi:Uncharacterized conserved protein, DUF1015 family [Ruminococcaceae bacterium YRB3002]|nr:Uncharacterized conserved protein, DUF1015 family [Ruminococcaceae bacterium YRB3002]